MPMHPLLENFHFIRPLWLLALVPLGLLLWAVTRPGGADNPWQRIVDARLLPLLMMSGAEGSARANKLALGVLATGWLIAVLALADPTWARKPQPVYQSAAARVVVLDLADSMRNTDLKPDRLTQARFKVEDVLAAGTEGQTGLVAYAGDAFTVSPLTRDTRTISALLKVLEPRLMPAQGERADLGLLKAAELMRQAGVTHGQVLLMADGIAPDQQAAAEEAAARLQREGYQVSVLGASLRSDPALAALAQAGGGSYQLIAGASGANLQSLLRSGQQSEVAAGAAQTDNAAQSWQERGPWLVLLLLPVALLAFRRNWLFGVVLLAGFAAQPQQANASTWTDLWQRPDQQAAKALAQGDYAGAAKLARDADQRGSAEYKRGNYQQALNNFSQDRGPDAAYNRGNALARLQHYPDAISAYEQALKQNPGDTDAKANKAAVEALLKKQQQQRQGDKKDQQGKQDQKDQKDQKDSQGQQQDKKNQPGQQRQQDQKNQQGQQQQQQPQQADKAEQARQDKQAQEQAQAPQQPGKPGDKPPLTPEQANAQRIEGEEKLAAEQWLRAIPDDPGGLLRRKFLYQYRQRSLGQQQLLQQQQQQP